MKIDRLVSIILLLLEKERVGAQQLADLFEVSPRTIYRDIDAINLAGIPVRATPGVGGGFEIMQNYKLDRKVFSADDLSAILMGLSSLSGMVRGSEVVSALAKVKSVIPAASAKEIELRANQIQVDLTPWTGNRNIGPNLELLKTALQQNRLLSFTYTGRTGTKTARRAEPYQLVLKNSQWYWLGFCHNRNDFRLFKLARTANLQMLAQTFVPRPYPNPQLDFSADAAAMQIEIQLRVHKSLLERVLDYCSDEQIVPDGDAYFFVNFPFIENDYYYDMLLSFGPRCECLGPARVRAALRRKIQALAALYKG